MSLALNCLGSSVTPGAYSSEGSSPAVTGCSENWWTRFVKNRNSSA